MKADAVSGSGFTTLTVHSIIPVHTGILPVIPSATPLANGIERTPGFSPLPTSVVAAGLTSTLTAVATHGVSNDAQSGQPASTPPGHISTVIIVLVAVGGTFFLLLVFIIWRACTIPKKRYCPTPSLPILQDPFADQVVVGDEESLFGGKERLSGQPPSSTVWNWTHYSHPSLSKGPFLRTWDRVAMWSLLRRRSQTKPRRLSGHPWTVTLSRCRRRRRMAPPT
ncbi:uncharacterized protein B0H18DRAFT_496357 [Fomitopsis serialis]|uniref:uncharacterized protein n=1 Tax=Fomitopsis serialis TaxID=139415 RepID=UPI002007FFD1|nr:uncharacterized protein B0H18DRAFT_496357 [Neoantrodia serialis]KAH9935033.1 hypothetical protein B0H18DRAFT_496357 [Neoantrodia serialis]